MNLNQKLIYYETFEILYNAPAIISSSVHVQRMIRTNRNMIFRYTYRDNYETFDIVISTEELKG